MSALINVLKDIKTHLSGGAALHPGSLIFAEDAPAVEVIQTAIESANTLVFDRDNLLVHLLALVKQVEEKSLRLGYPVPAECTRARAAIKMASDRR
jgi:hypothetical protein